MLRRYLRAMPLRPSFAVLAACLLIVAGEAVAQQRAPVTATASATILERPVRIVAAELRRDPRRLPPQAQLSDRRCDPGAPPGCRMIVVDMP
jgi:hypothetical protein